MKSRFQFIAVLRVTIHSRPPDLERGPLPISAESGTANAVLSSRPARHRYCENDKVAAILWGGVRKDTRWHKFSSTRVCKKTRRGNDIAPTLISFELIVWPESNRGLAVVHGLISDRSDQPLVELIELADIDVGHGAATRQIYQDYIGHGLSIDYHARRARMCYLVAHDESYKNHLSTKSSEIPEEWSWYLGTCQLPERISPPSNLQQSLAPFEISVSRDWLCHAMLDASTCFYNGRTNGTTLDDINIEIARREVRFRTLELDAILLTELQLVVAEHIEAKIARLDFRNDQQYLTLSKESVLAFYEMYWGQRFLERGPGQLLLEKVRLVRGVSDRVSALSASIASLELESQRKIATQTNAALGIIATIGLPASIAFSIWSAFQPQELITILWPAIGTILGSAALLYLMPGIRFILRDGLKHKLRWKQ